MSQLNAAVIEPLRVALIEDDLAIRAHFEATIGAADDLLLSWSTGTLGGARQHVKQPADVVLLDLGLPDGSGAELIPLLTQNAVKVLVITVFDDSATVLHAVRAGANGYLLKDAQPAALVSAIHAVMSGGAPVSAVAARHLTDALQAQEAPRVVSRISLTNREQEILQLFATGMSYRQVASELHISRHTVGDFVKSIYTKLNVNSRGEAVYEAVKLRLINM